MKRNCSHLFIKMKKRYDSDKASLSDETLIEDDMILNKRFTDVVFEDLVGISFDNCEFINCTFKGKIKNSTFFNVRFYKCEMSNIMLVDSGIHYSLFENCHMVGVNYIQMKIKNSEFRNNHMKLTQFSYVEFLDVEFNDCNVSDTNISNSDFKSDIIFDRCDLSELEVMSTRLKDVDVSSSKLEGIKTEVQNVSGMIVTEIQAIELITLLGVVIK